MTLQLPRETANRHSAQLNYDRHTHWEQGIYTSSDVQEGLLFLVSYSSAWKMYCCGSERLTWGTTAALATVIFPVTALSAWLSLPGSAAAAASCWG